MATLSEQVRVVGNDGFRYRVAMGMYKVAREIWDEPSTTNGYELRMQLARRIIDSDYSQFTKYAALVVADPELAAATIPADISTIPDSIILAAIRRMWSPLSGVM